MKRARKVDDYIYCNLNPSMATNSFLAICSQGLESVIREKTV